MDLYLRSSEDFRIEDDAGEKYSVREAEDIYKRLVTRGDAVVCNLAFSRLVMMNFDLEAVKRYYHEN